MFNIASDTNNEDPGNQIIVSGTAHLGTSYLTIKQNPTYTVNISEDGTWSKEITLPDQGVNTFEITSTNQAGYSSRSVFFTARLDSIAPTTTISVAEYSIDSDEFQIRWSADVTDLDYHDVQYKIGSNDTWQDWITNTTSTDKDYKDAVTNTYYFRVRGVDVNANAGDWAEIDVLIDLNSIVINEIQINDAEFVELYNKTSDVKDLEGYYFSYYSSSKTAWTDPWRNKAFPEDASIPANGYYLIGLNDYPEYLGNPNADWQVYTSKQLSDSKGTVAIFPFDPTTASSSQYAYDNRVDAVGWGSTSTIFLYERPPATIIPVSGESLTRDASHTDTQNNASDFSIATSPTPTNSNGEVYDPNFSAEPLWAMYQKDARHSGLSTLAGPAWATSTQATSTWIFQMKKNKNTDAGGRSQAVIDGAGTIYAVDDGGIVHAIDSNGIEKWAFKPEEQEDVGSGEANISPALSSNSQRVYSVYTDNEERKLWLFSVKTSDGTLDWKYSPSEDGYGQGITSPVLDSLGNIYFTSRMKIYSVSSSGSSNWGDGITLSPSRLGLNMPAIYKDGQNEYVYVRGKASNGPGDRYIWKLRVSDGSYEESAGGWKENPTGNNNLSNPISISATGTIYTGGSFDSRLYAVSPLNGSKSWDSILGGGGYGSVSGSMPNFDASGNIYVGTVGMINSGGFHKVNATGTLQWSVGLGSPGKNRYPAVIDSQARVYTSVKTTDFAYTIYAVDTEDEFGSVIWSYGVSSEPRGFAIGNGRIYVVTYDGKIYAF